ncbi:MAG: hypothetical protein VXX55_14365, partial [Planctomycetota bacterium]|nr:hypothetical protein [Planctomycetota bacterium]
DPAAVHRRLLELNSELDDASLEEAHQAIGPLCAVADDSFLGVMEAGRWEDLKQKLVEIEFISPDLDVSKAYDGQFLDPQVTPLAPEMREEGGANP